MEWAATYLRRKIIWSPEIPPKTSITVNVLGLNIFDRGIANFWQKCMNYTRFQTSAAGVVLLSTGELLSMQKPWWSLINRCEYRKSDEVFVFCDHKYVCRISNFKCFVMTTTRVSNIDIKQQWLQENRVYIFYAFGIVWKTKVYIYTKKLNNIHILFILKVLF